MTKLYLFLFSKLGDFHKLQFEALFISNMAKNSDWLLLSRQLTHVSSLIDRNLLRSFSTLASPAQRIRLSPRAFSDAPRARNRNLSIIITRARILRLFKCHLKTTFNSAKPSQLHLSFHFHPTQKIPFSLSVREVFLT